MVEAAGVEPPIRKPVCNSHLRVAAEIDTPQMHPHTKLDTFVSTH
jgi:hypothetical protein